VFVFWEGSQFHSNEAVFGLMAKHIAEGRAFPIFMYGQNYVLAVEAWLAAPLFAIAGPSVTALKLPLLVINLVAAWLLIRILTDDGGLPPVWAGLAAVFFVLPGPGTTGRLLEPSGCTLEPLLYVPLLWATRRRPAWCGAVLGIGVLNREFTMYGFASLMVIWMVGGELFTREGLRRLAIVLAVAGTIYGAAQAARPYGPAMGPGTTVADMHGIQKELGEVADRVCIDWPAVPGGYLDILRVHWPLLFSTAERPVRAFDVESDVVQGASWASAAVGLAMLLAFVRIAMRVGAERRWRPEYDVFAYLVLTAALSVSCYVVFRCGVIVPIKMRYDMLSLLGAVGLAAWYLAVERSFWLRNAFVALVLAWSAVAARPHAELLAEYVSNPPTGGKRQIVEALDARGIRYAFASYANAYPIAFLSNERILVSSTNRVRILAYEREVASHRAEAVRLARSPCEGGTLALPGFYFCPP